MRWILRCFWIDPLKRLFVVLLLFPLAILFAQSEKDSLSTPKVVLYLGGGVYSPWYSLGVLYAIRDYKLPVDSVVAVSWGAYVGALWSAGYELDAIQRILTDSSFVSRILIKNSEEESLASLPVSLSGEPSLAFRYSFFGDSLGYAHFRPKKIDPDFSSVARALFRLKIDETLNRTDSNVVPFTALACKEGRLRPARVQESLPFSATSAENCPTFVPADSFFAVYVAAYPLRKGKNADSPQTIAAFENELEQIRVQKENPKRKLVLLRPHAFADDSPLTLMQTGYSDVEKKMGELSPLFAWSKERPAAPDSILPRFQMDPSFENIPSAYYSHVSSLWNAADTGMAAASYFLERIAESPFYDSVRIEMDSVGVARVSAQATPILEFRLGGFGSNILGPLAYAGMDFRYVDQFEYLFGIDGFVGEHSYAVRPSFQLRGLFGGRADFSIFGNVSKIRPLKSYFSDEEKILLLNEIESNDLTLAFSLQNSVADLDVRILLGESSFRTALDDAEKLQVHSLLPDVSLTRERGDFEEWFGHSGYRLRGNFGWRSVNLTAVGFGDAPLYVSSTLDAQMEFAPLRFLALGFGASAGMNIRRESGHGYVYPKELEESPENVAVAVDNWYRLHPELSPWTSSWNFASTSSHHYAAVRMNAGLHRGIFGAWIFAAYMRDFEENPYIDLKADRLLLEPLLRISYRSIDVRFGMSRLVSFSDFRMLKNFDDYHYFFQVGTRW